MLKEDHPFELADAPVFVLPELGCNTMNYQFSQPKNLAVFTCTHVLDEKAPILSVSLGNDGYFQFLCGKKHETSEGKIASLSSIVSLDDSLNELAHIQPGNKYSRESSTAQFNKVTR